MEIKKAKYDMDEDAQEATWECPCGNHNRNRIEMKSHPILDKRGRLVMLEPVLPTLCDCPKCGKAFKFSIDELSIEEINTTQA